MSEMKQAERDKGGGGQFAFPKQRKEPIHDAAHVRNAIARFNQVEGVTNQERDEAWRRIKEAASRFNVELNEASWHDLPHGGKK
jgi:cell division protein FtsX